MQEWYILGVGNGILFREVSSVQQCPYRVVPLYLSVLCIIVSEWKSSPQEWWNTESLSEYLRKWNPIIHEWLKAYVYRPLRTRGVPAWQATLVILVVSAFEHDFLLSAGLGYFMPVYMIEYGLCGESL